MNAYVHNVAVMAQRIEPADSLEFFPTAPWGARTFAHFALKHLWPFPDALDASVWDPACGQGHMALALEEQFKTVHASDIFDYGFGGVSDFLNPDASVPIDVDWIVTNPPFSLADQFILKALSIAHRGVAMLCRSNFAEGQRRYQKLFCRRPPQIEVVFVERLPMHKGRWVINGSTATAYSWFCWLAHPPHGWGATRKIWMAPNSKLLSKPDDWLKFGGCQDLPKDHKVMQLIAAAAKAKADAGDTEAAMAKVRDQLERLL